jgi:hypothetical protein
MLAHPLILDPWRGDMSKSNSSRRSSVEDFLVSPSDRPGWVNGNDHGLSVGQQVYCAGGEGTVQAVLGKISDGSRLIEVRLADPDAKPFFASSSNLLVAPHVSV